MAANELISLSRACEAIGIPRGVREMLPQGATVRIMQSLGSGYTVVDNRGYMLRIDARDADALGLAAEAGTTSAPVDGDFQEEMVWQKELRLRRRRLPDGVLDIGQPVAEDQASGKADRGNAE